CSPSRWVESPSHTLGRLPTSRPSILRKLVEKEPQRATGIRRRKMARTNLGEMRVLVFDSSMSGHHAFYLRLLLPALLELSPEVTLVTGRNASESREFQI